ncbi:hypothetical protein PF003_g27348 [Phytophthora fragariae]|nr:hypothetical protein PF003_g27348 [Phytophthora fragariae]
MRIVEPAGFENFLVRREDTTGPVEEFIAHSSFLVTYHHSSELLEQVAADLTAQLAEEDAAPVGSDVTTRQAVICAAQAPRA